MKIDERRAMTKLIDDLRKENLAYRYRIETYERQTKVLETGFAKAELVRLNSEIGRLNEQIDRMTGHLHGVTEDKNMALKKSSYQDKLMASIRKSLGVKTNQEILPALTVLKK